MAILVPLFHGVPHSLGLGCPAPLTGFSLESCGDTSQCDITMGLIPMKNPNSSASARAQRSISPPPPALNSYLEPENRQMAHFTCCHVQECGKLWHCFPSSCSQLPAESSRGSATCRLVRPHHCWQLGRIYLKASRESCSRPHRNLLIRHCFLCQQQGPRSWPQQLFCWL